MLLPPVRRSAAGCRVRTGGTLLKRPHGQTQLWLYAGQGWTDPPDPFQFSLPPGEAQLQRATSKKATIRQHRCPIRRLPHHHRGRSSGRLPRIQCDPFYSRAAPPGTFSKHIQSVRQKICVALNQHGQFAGTGGKERSRQDYLEVLSRGFFGGTLARVLREEHACLQYLCLADSSRVKEVRRFKLYTELRSHEKGAS